MLTRQTLRKIFDNVATCSLLVVMVILVGISILSFDARQRFIENDFKATHTYRVIGSINAILSDLKDAETGQRGFLLTGDRAYLVPFYGGVSRTQHDITAARALLRDEPAQEARLDELQSAASNKIAELEQTITLRQHLGLPAAVRIVQAGVGKKYMDEARSDVASMDDAEESILSNRTESAIRAGTISRTWSILGSLFAIFLISTAIIFVAGYLRQREETEAENLTLIEQARDAALQQRVFLKDVLSSVTEGRLSLCDDEMELPQPIGEQGTSVDLSAAPALRDLRQAVIQAARGCGFQEDRVQDLATSVSEAGMNAIIHGGGGEAVVRADGAERVQVWIKDHGKGIALGSLPQSTLKRGYS